VNGAANVAANDLRACRRWTERNCNDESNRNGESNWNDEVCNREGWSKANSSQFFLKVHLRLLKSWSRPAGAGLGI
jgi:hypothetical protein